MTRKSEDETLAEAAALHEREPHPDLDERQLRLHLSMHAVAETQLATGDPPCTGQVFERLLAEGLSRHQAIHAICSVVAEETFMAMQHGQHFDAARYCNALAALAAKDWTDRDSPHGDSSSG